MELFIGLLLLVVFMPIGECVMCFSCASSSLHNKWYLTGLTGTTSSFTRCDSPMGSIQQANQASSTNMESCDSMGCMTYVFQDLEDLANTDSAEKHFHVVRGCRSRLTRVATSYSNSGVNVGMNSGLGSMNMNPSSGMGGTWCGYGSLSNRSMSLDKKMESYIQYCGTDLCNNQRVISSDMRSMCPTAIQQTQTVQGGFGMNSMALSCVTCSNDENCNANRQRFDQGEVSCTPASWCFKSDLEYNGERIVRKHCAPVNPYGMPVCTKIYSQTLLDGVVPLKVKGRVCYCNTENCNGSTEAKFSSIILICATIVLMIFHQC